MARFDFHNNDYEWGFTFQMGGQAFFLESTPLQESSERLLPDRLAKAKPAPKKVTRKIRKSSLGSNWNSL